MNQIHLIKTAAVIALCVATWGQVLAQTSRTTLTDADDRNDTERSQRFDFHSVRGRKPLVARTGRYEGETDFELVGKSRVQGMKHYGDQWSGGAHLLWDGAVGESMETSIDVPADGIYDLALQLTVASDYGLFELSIPGTKVKRSVDLYGPRVELAALLTLEDVRLKRGKRSVSFKLIGSNPKARKFREGYLLGLDYLQLTRKDKPAADTSSRHQADDQSSAPESSHSRVPPLSFDALVETMNRYCYQCHGGGAIEADLDLTAYTRHEVMLADIDAIREIRDAVAGQEMPPKEKKQPSPLVRAAMVAAFDAVIDEYLRGQSSSTAVVMRRLNRYEYNNAVRDMLRLRGDIYPLPEKTIRSDISYFDPASGRFPNSISVGNRTLGKNQVEKQILTGVSPFAIDLQAEGGFNNRGSQLSVSPILLESFVTLGRSIVNSPEFDGYCGITEPFFSPPADTTSHQQQGLARERLASFLELAFRSEVEPEVLERYHQFFARKLRETGSFRQSMKEVVAAALASPRFIYISETAIPKTAASESESMLDGYELATRLSFFLWSSIPDEQLLAAARDGSLTRPTVLDAQVKRMLEDPLCQALSQNFARQWLRLDQLVTAVPDFDRFPQYYSRIGCEQWKFGLQMMIEPLLLMESIMVEDRSIMLLVDSDYSYRSDELQSWYNEKVPFAGRDNRNRFNTNQQAYRRRILNDRRQGGVITSAAALTMTSAPLRTSPISRGAWVATVIFNKPPPPPPDIVPPIEADDKAIEAKGLTLRERLQQHQVNQSCASCHAKIDPLGFALENFDAVGRWRDTYGSGLEIDASGKLFGTQQFNDVVELKDALLDNPDWFMRAFCEHLLSYALGRELELADAPAVDSILAQVAADHGQFTTVVREIVQSHPFRHRAQSSDAKESE